jgi:hypothetical protein
VLGAAGPAPATMVNPLNTSADRPGITEVPGGDYDIA